MDNIREVVIELFENNVGIHPEQGQEIILKDLPMESLVFINFIIDIETTLDIILPEEYLVINDLPDLNTFARIVENIYCVQHMKET